MRSLRSEADNWQVIDHHLYIFIVLFTPLTSFIYFSPVKEPVVP